MISLRKYLAILTYSLCFCATAFADDMVELTDAAPANSELIYIQQAKVAELSHNPDRLGYYQLKVSGSDKTLVFFSDKPDRSAGTLTLSQFVKTWQNNSTHLGDSPNAVISYLEFRASTESGVGADILQLSSPQYDPGTNSVTFTAKPLHEYEITTGTFENLVIIYDGVNDLESYEE